jgi:magnesium transporter
MPLFGELFLSDVIKQPVYDPKGEIIGRLKDAIVVKGDPLPKVTALITEKNKQLSLIKWENINIFNKRIISTYLNAGELPPYEQGEEDLLSVRDILDKQIVDANGAKVVRVNDIKLEGYKGDAVLVAVDVGARGLLRRIGFERGSEHFLKLFNVSLSNNLISWNYIQHLKPKLKVLSLTVPSQMVSELHPADLAEIISNISREDGAQFFKDLDIETAAEALSELKAERQAEIINSMDTEQAADIIEEMPPDEAADILGDLPAEKAKEILEHIEIEDAEDIHELLGHEDDTAGGLMNNEFIAYRPETTVGDAIELFKKDAGEIESVYYIYIVDAQEKLLGVASLRDLILADPLSKLSEVMETKIKTVTPDTDEMTVAGKISKYNLVALPVVNTEGDLLGIVSVDTIMDRILPPSAKRKRQGR